MEIEQVGAKASRFARRDGQAPSMSTNLGDHLLPIHRDV